MPSILMYTLADRGIYWGGGSSPSWTFPPPFPSPPSLPRPSPLPPTSSPLLFFLPLPFPWSGVPGFYPRKFCWFLHCCVKVPTPFQRNKIGFFWWVWPRENTFNYHLWLFQITKLCSDVRPWRGYMLRLNVCIWWGWIEAPLICLSLIVSLSRNFQQFLHIGIKWGVENLRYSTSGPFLLSVTSPFLLSHPRPSPSVSRFPRSLKRGSGNVTPGKCLDFCFAQLCA